MWTQPAARAVTSVRPATVVGSPYASNVPRHGTVTLQRAARYSQRGPMMSENYHCRALEKTGTVLRLRVTIIHPDERRLHASKCFVVQLLHEYSDPTRMGDVLGAPLFGVIPRYADDADARYFDLRDELIERVDVESDRFYPPVAEFEVSDFTQQLDTLPQRVLRVTARRAEWLAHVRAGDTWLAAARDWEAAPAGRHRTGAV